MIQRRIRGLLLAVVALMSGVLGQVVSCTTQDQTYGTFPRLVSDGALSGLDLCFIFDCQSGFFGGTWQPCSENNPLFVDCPTTGDQNQQTP